MLKQSFAQIARLNKVQPAQEEQRSSLCSIANQSEQYCLGVAVIDFKFPKRSELRVIDQVHKRTDAERLAEENKEGVIGGLARAISHKKSEWALADYFVKYEPFWHITGDSFFEYIRKAQYHVDVKPEVRSVKISQQVVEVNGDKPVAVISGDEHCFEKYNHEILISACTHGKSKDALKPYLEAKSRTIKSTKELMKADIDVLPIETRASFLVSEMVKQLLKPVQADKIIKEKIAIKKLALYFRPIHVFNYKDDESCKMKTVEVDAVTGEVHKPSVLVQKLRGATPTKDILFDVGGFADCIIPGAGLGSFIGKNLMKYRRRKKAKRAMESSKSAAEGKRLN